MNNTSDLLAAALSEERAWNDRPREEDLRPLPAVPAVYLLIDASGAPILLATTQNLRRLMLARLVDIPAGTTLDDAGSESSLARAPRADLAAIARGVRWRAIACAFEARLWYWRLARRLHPQDYRERIAFGPAWFLQIDGSQAAPEIRLSDNPTRAESAGPFPSRAAAQRTLEGLWDLFELCRYPEQVRRAPHGQRCAYADMGRCDAPCDGSASIQSYAQRVDAAWRFVTGAAPQWIADARMRMADAAQQQRFERAGLLKNQIAFAQRWVNDFADVRAVNNWRLLLALPVTRRRAWKLYQFERLHLIEGPVLMDRHLARGLRTWLDARPPAPAANSSAGGFEAVHPPAGSHPGPLVADDPVESAWLVSHLLHSSERAAALVADLPGGAIPDGWIEAFCDQRKQQPLPDATGESNSSTFI